MNWLIAYFAVVALIWIVAETIDFLDRRKAEKILWLKLNHDWSIK